MDTKNEYRPGYNSGYVSRVFKSREEADREFDNLRSRGYTDADINVMMSDETRSRFFNDDAADSNLGDKVAENAGKGSLIGGGIGAVVGAIAAIGSNVLLPGLGLVVAGPLAAGLAGLGTGAAAGGLIGALTGAGVPEEEARRYENDIKEGGIYMGYKPKHEEDARHSYDRWHGGTDGI